MGMTDGKRTVLLVAHTGRPRALSSARFVVDRLTAAGLTVRVLSPEAAELCCARRGGPARPAGRAGAELVIVIGGDGTLLRAAEIARPAGVPLLGREPGPRGLPGRGRARRPGRHRGPRGGPPVRGGAAG